MKHSIVRAVLVSFVISIFSIFNPSELSAQNCKRDILALRSAGPGVSELMTLDVFYGGRDPVGSADYSVPLWFGPASSPYPLVAIHRYYGVVVDPTTEEVLILYKFHTTPYPELLSVNRVSGEVTTVASFTQPGFFNNTNLTLSGLAADKQGNLYTVALNFGSFPSFLHPLMRLNRDGSFELVSNVSGQFASVAIRPGTDLAFVYQGNYQDPNPPFNQDWVLPLDLNAYPNISWLGTFKFAPQGWDTALGFLSDDPKKITAFDSYYSPSVLFEYQIPTSYAGTVPISKMTAIPEWPRLWFATKDASIGSIVLQPSDDCNGNGMKDSCEIAMGLAKDNWGALVSVGFGLLKAVGDGIPDECQMSANNWRK